MDILKETKQTFDYGCAMLYFDFPQMYKIHDAINLNDIYIQEGDRSYGLEDEPHCTLLYGLHKGVSVDDIKKITNNYTFTPLKAHNVSLFANPDYDVLKFDIEGENLHEINSDLQQYPFTSTFPDYHPHMTIGYLKPGTGKRYVKMFKNTEFPNMIPQYVIYSTPEGDKEIIDIKVKL